MGCMSFHVHRTPHGCGALDIGVALAAGVGRIDITAFPLEMHCLVGAICIGVRGGQHAKRAGHQEQRARLVDEHVYWILERGRAYCIQPQ